MKQFAGRNSRKKKAEIYNISLFVAEGLKRDDVRLSEILIKIQTHI